MDIADEYIKKALMDANKEKERKQDIETQKLYDQAVKKFNNKPKEGFKFLKDNGLSECTPQEIAKFLQNTQGLNKTKVGEVLGEPDEWNQTVLKYFLDEMDFTNLEFDTALRYIFPLSSLNSLVVDVFGFE